MKNQRIILISLAAGVVVVILVAVLGVLLHQKKLDLYNIDQVESGLSSSEVSELEGFIWQSLKNNHGLSDETVGLKVLIRPSSFERVVQNDVVNYDFLIDVDDLKATYEVSFALMKGQGFYESPVVDCPVPSLMKYSGTYCRGEKTSTMTVTVGRELPYYFNLASGELVTVTLAREETGEEYLNVRVSACGNEAVAVNAREEVQEWIKSLGYNPDDYQIKIPEFCDGAAR
ncbi:hypothetical protein IKF89_02830 [Candidatus Saccharibacteria bacterium]|nr:hypothetical protein [Candidatus Saccharibacteria bacterium]